MRCPHVLTSAPVLTTCALLPCLQVLWSFLLLLISSSVFSSLVLVFFSSATSVRYLLIYSTSLVKFLLCPSILLRSVRIFVTITLNSLSGKSLVSTSLRSFSNVLILFFCLEYNIFLWIFIFIYSLCFIFPYVLDKTAASTRLKEWPYGEMKFIVQLFAQVLGYIPKPLWLSKQPTLFLVASCSWGTRQDL